MISFWLVLACADPPPETVEDCVGLGDPTAQEDCRLSMVVPHLGDSETVRDLIRRVPTAESRDLLRIRLAVQDPNRAAPLCQDAETEAAQQRCAQVLGRPHLRAPRPE